MALANLETAVLEACTAEEEWPAQIAAGVYAAVDHAIAHPQIAQTLASGVVGPGRYDGIISRLVGFLRARAPISCRLPVSTDEALVAGLVGLVGDHLRLGRIDRLEELRPDLVLLALLPYLGYADAKSWANKGAPPFRLG